MTAAARRVRLLRVRTIEHRVAAFRLAAADATHKAVTHVCDRVAQLHADIAVPAGEICGRDLQSFGELSERLDSARATLARSLVQAEQARSLRDAERIAAQLAAERTERVHANASRREAAERDVRAAAARPPRLKKPGAQR